MKLLIPSKEEAAKLLSDPSMFRGLSVCAESLPPSAMWNRAIVADESGWCMPRLFHVEDTQQIVGSGAFKSAPNAGTVEIGYGISPVCRRRGYATEGIRLLTDEALTSGSVEEVYAEVSPSNEASRGVLGKLGFEMIKVVTTDEGIMEVWSVRKLPNRIGGEIRGATEGQA